MARKLSRKEFIEAARSPKRRFRVLVLGTSGTVHLREAVPAPCYWFERHEEVVEADGSYTVNPTQATVTMVVEGVPAVLFYLSGSRLETCTFTFNLTQHQLVNAVAAMKKAKLTTLIPGAASNALENLPEGRRVVLEAELRLLAGSRRQGSTTRREE